MRTNTIFSELSYPEKSEFLGKLIIAAETEYFSECSAIVNKAQRNGLFTKVIPLIGDNYPELHDLNSPIENGISSHSYH